MLATEFTGLVDAVERGVATADDRTSLSAALASIDRLVAWCESARIDCVRRLAAVVASPERVVVEVSRLSVADAQQVTARVGTLDGAPPFAEALARGAVAVDHVDRLGRTLRRLDAGQRARLNALAPRLVAIAATSTPAEFARHLAHEERILRAGQGDRLAQQRAEVRLRTRVDHDSGMHHFTLIVDPVTGVRLHHRIRDRSEALFHGGDDPGGCPTVPLERHSFLQAHALLGLIESGGPRSGRPDVIVVVDTTGTEGPPAVDWGVPAEVPASVLEEIVARADTSAVVVRGGAVLYAPGLLDLGRSTRLANRDQRRALRALYPRCAIPDCETRFDHCTVHHVVWWRHGGRTDLSNLLPLCSQHHHDVHERGWSLRLTGDRTLTVRFPDGSVRTAPPPRRRPR